eukprot:scaffold13234_cov36-Tisochrysis_lutea.AAC.4
MGKRHTSRYFVNERLQRLNKICALGIVNRVRGAFKHPNARLWKSPFHVSDTAYVVGPILHLHFPQVEMGEWEFGLERNGAPMREHAFAL